MAVVSVDDTSLQVDSSPSPLVYFEDRQQLDNCVVKSEMKSAMI